MIALTPLQILYQDGRGDAVLLPEELKTLYGRLRFHPNTGRPHVMGNFVTTIDGVASLNEAGVAGGGEISGHNPHDRMVMGILRSTADAVVVGAGTLRAVPQHLWTPQHVFPDLAPAYRELREFLGKTGQPLNVIVTGSGEVDLGRPVFSSGEVQALLVTTELGADRLAREELPPWVRVASVRRDGHITATEVLRAVGNVRPTDRVLVEGGPHLMGDFLAEKLMDDLFLTMSPQIAGRSPESDRPGLVEGKIFAPADPLWSTLSEVRRGGSHLFLRYSLSHEG